jgi:hypothetical protein
MGYALLSLVVRIALTTIVCLFHSLQVSSQEAFADHRPRLLFDTEIGTQTSLGYKLPSTAFGPSLEIPVAKRMEFQVSSDYSPDRKAITNDGNSLKLSGSAIGFANHQIGFMATIERNWLWTSQFDKSAWLPSAGVVIRSDGAGRLYLTYVFPTGCVWATPSNPCKIQSNRLQGIELRQDVRSASHARWGFKIGFYRFCDQGNPNDPQAGRKCHFAETALATLRFEFHLGGRSLSPSSNPDKSDNF